MEAVVRPEPSEEERQALLEALEALEQPERAPYDRAWREAALREGVDGDDP